MRPPAEAGKVYLVGAGPGDPRLITLRGLECLQSADVVLYDYLANPRLLEHAPRGAELVSLGRHGGGSRLWTQSEINRRMIDEAQHGKRVVRLKSGDPAIFARSAEETDALHAAGVPYEVVPGITAALAVSSYTGVCLTHRDVSSAVALVTGQQRQPDEPHDTQPIDYQALAAFPGTLVFYMGVTTAGEWTSALIAAGKSPQTPTIIARRVSWPDQSTHFCTLAEVPQVVAERQIRPPVLVIVGDVVPREAVDSWFVSRPLFGRSVLVTRPRHQAGPLRDALEELGADVLLQPAIEITDPANLVSVDRVIGTLGSYDWLVFSSANGVRFLLQRLLSQGGDVRILGHLKLAAIGPGTAQQLRAYHLNADVQPEQFRAESLAASLIRSDPNARFMLVRASRGRDVLADELQAAGGIVDQVVAYQSTDVAEADPAIRQRLAAGGIDWITVTSSAIARSLAAMFGEDLHKARLVSISPITSGMLRELGYTVAAEASTYTMPGVVEAIVAAETPA